MADAKVEERHVEAARETATTGNEDALFTITIEDCAELLANTEAATRADERQRVVEECCAAMCARCASGEVAEYREASKNWCHDVYVCRANPIRRALGEEG